MNEESRVRVTYAAAGQQAGDAWRRINAHPNWIIRTTAAAFALIVLLPILLLVILAVVVASSIFLVLLGINIVLKRLRSLLPRQDGRENVRILRRD